MRAFVVLCLVAAACADHLGYNYHPVDQSYTPGGGSGGIGSPSGHSPSFASPSFGGNNAGPSYGGNSAGPSFGGHNGSPGFGGSSPGGLGSPGFGGSSPGGLGSSSNNEPVGTPELDKEFYTFTADENDFNDPSASNQVANSLKQGLRVVFIKGPENNGLEDAALALAKQAADQQTAIYVLNKQTDLNDLANKLNQINSNANNKPDVHFVKYRTPEDAANAQKAIQSEYDNLGGASRNFDGGVAPSLNFASKAPVAPAGGHHGGPGNQGSYGQPSSYNPQSAFLPQSAFAPQAPFPPQGSFGSQGAHSSPSGSNGAGPSSTYLPASIFRRRFRF